MKKYYFLISIFFFSFLIFVSYNQEERLIVDSKLEYSDEFEKYFRDITYNETGSNYYPGYKQVELDKMLARLSGPTLSASSDQDNPNFGSSAAAVATFTERGPGNVSGRTRGLIVDAADASGKTFYAASPGGGIWKGIHSGAGATEKVSWTNLTSGLPNINFNSLAQSQSNTDIIYAGSGESHIGGSGGWGDGIFKSTDGGSSWTNVSKKSGGKVISDFGTVHRIIVDPTNPDIVVITAGHNYYCNTYIYKTSNGGTSWTKVHNFNSCHTYTQIVAAPSDFNTQYAVSKGKPLLKSTDAGDTWVATTPFGISGSYGRYEIAVSHTDPNKVYAGIRTSANGPSYLYRTLDGGSSWTHIQENGTSGDPRYSTDFWLDKQGYYDNCIALNPLNDDVVYVGGIDLFKFTVLADNTKNSVHLTDVYEDVGSDGISQKNGYVHPDQHTITTVSDGGGKFRLVVGNDGGLAISNSSSDPGVNEGDWIATKYKWAYTNVPYLPTDVGYRSTQFYGADKVVGRKQYLGGTQDNGTYLSPKDSVAKETTPHARVWGGDGFEVITHWENKDSMMTGSQYNGFARMTNGQWFSSIGQNTKGNTIAPFITRLSTSYQDPDVVYAVHKDSGVWRSKDFGGDRFKLIEILNPSPNKYYSRSDVEVSIANPRFVWAGGAITSDYNLFLSKDWGKTFNPITKPAGVSSSISGIYSHPTEDSTVYILFSRPKKSKVLESKDLGATWTDITGFPANFTEGTSTAGFPDVETHSLVVMPHDPDVIWVGTNIGIVETTDRGASWNIIPYATSNFPHVTVWDMKIKDQGEIVLATHGRGIWTATVPDLVNWEPKENLISLSVDTVNIVEGQDAKLTITAEKDVSPNGPITVNLSVTGTVSAPEYTLGGPSYTILDSANKSRNIIITTTDDNDVESDETIIVDISTVVNGKESGTQQVTITVKDNDGANTPPVVSLSIDNTSIIEDSGVSTITATLDKAPNSGDVVVALKEFGAGGTAVAADYTLSSKTITISSGTTGTVTVTAVQDSDDEDDETVVISIDSVNNATLSSDTTVTITITDDDTVTGIEDQGSGGSISIYPNPTSGIFKIRFNDTWKGNVDLRVLDIFGRSQYLRNIDNSSGQVEHQVDISNKSDGIFVIELTKDDKKAIKKVVKQ